jgi:hypothetical protein
MIPLSFKDYLIPMVDDSGVLNSNNEFPHKEFAQVKATLHARFQSAISKCDFKVRL